MFTYMSNFSNSVPVCGGNMKNSQVHLWILSVHYIHIIHLPEIPNYTSSTTFPWKKGQQRRGLSNLKREKNKFYFSSDTEVWHESSRPRQTCE